MFFLKKKSFISSKVSIIMILSFHFSFLFKSSRKNRASKKLKGWAEKYFFSFFFCQISEFIKEEKRSKTHFPRFFSFNFVFIYSWFRTVEDFSARMFNSLFNCGRFLELERDFGKIKFNVRKKFCESDTVKYFFRER